MDIKRYTPHTDGETIVFASDENGQWVKYKDLTAMQVKYLTQKFEGAWVDSGDNYDSADACIEGAKKATVIFGGEWRRSRTRGGSAREGSLGCRQQFRSKSLNTKTPGLAEFQHGSLGCEPVAKRVENKYGPGTYHFYPGG